jgi:hypothetical protein
MSPFFRLVTLSLPLTFFSLAVLAAGPQVRPAPSNDSSYHTQIPPEQDPPLSAGAMVSVRSYDAATRTFHLIITDEPAVGPNVATPEDLAAAVSTLKLETLKSRPQSIVGNEYQLDKELRLLSARGVTLRKQALRKKTK